MKKVYTVVGLGFGDEGKGLTTDYLCRISKNPLVIRYNGGHQAGHNVVFSKEKSHIFSNFGSGTFRGVSTYWSSYCTFFPVYFFDEYVSLGTTPAFYLDRLSPVTTHYDLIYNRAIERSRGVDLHGSCGVGFGATVERHYVKKLRFCAEDLLDLEIVKSKLALIKEYYLKKLEANTNFKFDAFNHRTEDIRFLDSVEKIRDLQDQGVVKFVSESDIFQHNNTWSTYIFEGAQGILLDVEHGFKPHVTKSNTTSKNALEIIERNFFKDSIDHKIVYVSRCYHTRHGAGPFGYSSPGLTLRNAERETNTFNTSQGHFKTDFIDVDLVNYALDCDMKYSVNIPKCLIITCVDQLTTVLGYKKSKKLNFINYVELPDLFNCHFTRCIYSFSNCSDNLILNQPEI